MSEEYHKKLIVWMLNWPVYSARDQDLNAPPMTLHGIGRQLELSLYSKGSIRIGNS